MPSSTATTAINKLLKKCNSKTNLNLANLPVVLDPAQKKRMNPFHNNPKAVKTTKIQLISLASMLIPLVNPLPILIFKLNLNLNQLMLKEEIAKN